MPKWMKENPQLKDLICKYTVRYDNYCFKRFKIIGAPRSFYYSRKRNLKTCLKQYKISLKQSILILQNAL